MYFMDNRSNIHENKQTNEYRRSPKVSSLGCAIRSDLISENEKMRLYSGGLTFGGDTYFQLLWYVVVIFEIFKFFSDFGQN